MTNYTRHPFHLVHESPWPILTARFSLGLTAGIINWFHYKSIPLFLFRIFCICLTAAQWWRDVSREGAFIGFHSKIVELGLRWGICLFIVSEIFLFLSFFWAFFHRRIAPNVELGLNWPPMGVSPFNPTRVPLLNSIILISSGVTVTYRHHALMEKNVFTASQRLLLTCALGAGFTGLQYIEYVEASFSMADRVYGSTFFITTGFHGLHVIVGTLFLWAIHKRITRGDFNHTHHFGFEAAAWYWHFVDVVWLFLFIVIYIWGYL